jgi:hypothetical protein
MFDLFIPQPMPLISQAPEKTKYCPTERTSISDEEFVTAEPKKPNDFEGVLFGRNVTIVPKSVNYVQVFVVFNDLGRRDSCEKLVNATGYIPEVNSGNSKVDQEIKELIQYSSIIIKISNEVKSVVPEIKENQLYKILKVIATTKNYEERLAEISNILGDDLSISGKKYLATNIVNHNKDDIKLLYQLTPEKIDITHLSQPLNNNFNLPNSSRAVFNALT